MKGQDRLIRTLSVLVAHRERTLRPSISRTSASLLLLIASTVLAATVLCPDAFAQAQHTAAPAPQAPAAGAPAETGPATAAKPPGAEAKDAKEAKEAKSSGTAATVVNLKTIEGIMGKSVRSRSGNEDMGHIVDVLVDAGGQTRAAVIDFGGFLGVGSRKVAVAWKTLDFANSIQSGSVTVSLTRDQVRQAPEYKVDEPVVILEGATPKEAVPPAKPAQAPSPAPAPPPAGHIQDSPPR